MYTDTKTSCESVTTASKAVDDPELVSLHRNFRTQRDRLLAWGLDWSDASAAQPNDIDESLTQAGFSDVVASVMSSIQELLNEAERLQHGGVSGLPPKADQSSKEGLPPLPAKTHWTNEDIDRSKTLLRDLTGCIDTLYDLSRSRRSMSTGGHSSIRRKRRQSTKGSDFPSHPDSSAQKEKFLQTTSPSILTPQDDFDYPQFSNTVPPIPDHVNLEGRKVDDSAIKAPGLLEGFLIDHSALQLSGASHDNSPPPYEVIAASTNSRVVGRMQSSALPFVGPTTDSTVSILVEFMPMMLEPQSSVTVPERSRLGKIHDALNQLVENARVAHLGLLKFLGYYIDSVYSRYAFVYQMPVNYFPFLRNPSDLFNDLKPKPLVSLFHSGDNATIPNLETRFRLAYDLLMALLHLRSQNMVHGNLNSSNILIFPGLADSSNGELSLTEDLRRPYLTSFAQFSGDGPAPEPLSSSMYRHPDDKKLIDDDAAWAYDLYSLGLVLMEIGLWTPVSRLWKMKYNNSMFKQRIENLYLQKLSPKCGTAYLNVVQLCLDAPNFHLSTQPLDDLKLRIPQTFHYPVLDLSEPDSTFSFSMNFIYTMCKITWSCCRIDLFSAPAAEELDDCLPLALVPETEEPPPIPPRKVPAEHHAVDVPWSKEQSANIPFNGAKVLKDEENVDDRRMKKRTFRKHTDVEIPQAQLSEWNMQLMPKLKRLLEKILKDAAESCSATLMMTGETAEACKPTICVTCASAKRVRAALKRYFSLDKDEWDLVVIRGHVQRSKIPKDKRRRPPGSEFRRPDPSGSPVNDANPCFKKRPLCGASIGAFLNEEHLPAVSYGGAVLVDGMTYGMTVHHMLEAPSDDEDDERHDSDNYDYEPSEAPLRSAATRPRDSERFNPNLTHAYGIQHPHDDGFEFEVSDDDDVDDPAFEGSLDDYWLSDDLDFSSDDERTDVDDGDEDGDVASIGDTACVEPGEEPWLHVTQPAMDDMREGFYPAPEDRDDEHLASFKLGYVHASSGLRRWVHKGIKHEIDWALIRMKDDRTDPRNIVYQTPGIDQRLQSLRRVFEGGSRSPVVTPPGRQVHLNNVARMEDLGGRKVHCCGRTSGLQSGQISRAMTLVKLHGRQSFSISFCVDGNFGGMSLLPSTTYEVLQLTD